MTESSSTRIHDQLDHPVIDVDGHMIEFMPVFFDYLKEVAGADMVDRMWSAYNKGDSHNWYHTSEDDRRRFGVMRPAYWALPAENTRDRATAMLPRLMRERLPEMGIDFSVVYPTVAMAHFNINSEDVRRATCRAHNMMVNDMFKGCEDRLTPAAVIPCYSPEEALEELDFSIGELGMKVPMIGNLVRRPLKPVEELEPMLGAYAFWVDTLAIDSLYDYDPVWQKCMDLNVPVTAHAVSQGIGMRRSISNYMYNQTGHFADAAHAFAKSLFFGGVTKRFPDLNVAFLECGVAWAACLVCDLKERVEKRNLKAVQQFNPELIKKDELDKFLEEYGGEIFAGKKASSEKMRNQEPLDMVDDFGAADVNTMQDLYDRIMPNFYYGCEADDRMNVTGFDAKLLPFGEKLKAVFSSDFGHWDVPDMSGVLGEAYELVEEGFIDDGDFRDFVFTNPVKLLVGMNPAFFKGTAVEAQVDRLVSENNLFAA